jgi:hypothetical protein
MFAKKSGFDTNRGSTTDRVKRRRHYKIIYNIMMEEEGAVGGEVEEEGVVMPEVDEEEEVAEVEEEEGAM